MRNLKLLTVLLLPVLLAGCVQRFPTTHEGRLKVALNTLAASSREPMTTPHGHLDESVKHLDTVSRELNRFYALNDAAKESFEVGRIEDARKYAEELLTLAETIGRDWNYGNAIQDGNLVLGRIALKEGRTNEAKRYLLHAGESPGSPQMNTFGPNMSLAKDLIQKGEREVVVQYFELCRKFWQMHNGKLDKWTQQVNDGNIPDFGANLVY